MRGVGCWWWTWGWLAFVGGFVHRTCSGSIRDPSEVVTKINQRPRCGDFLCNGDESTATCPKDCGEPFDYSNVPWNFVHSGCVRDWEATLTFDDGPTPEVTDLLLDILKAKGVPASFFVVGDRFWWTDNDLIRRMIAEGHQVFDHTYSHCNLSSLTAEETRHELNLVDMGLMNIMCQKPRVVRPPFLEYRGESTEVLNDMGFMLSMPNVDTRDWDFAETNPDRMIEWMRIGMDYARPRGIVVLQHDISSAAVLQTPNVIDEVWSQGYKFVTFDECIFPTGTEGAEKERAKMYNIPPAGMRDAYCLAGRTPTPPMVPTGATPNVTGNFTPPPPPPMKFVLLPAEAKEWYVVYSIVAGICVFLILCCCCRSCVLKCGTDPPKKQGGG